MSADGTGVPAFRVLVFVRPLAGVFEGPMAAASAAGFVRVRDR